MVCLLIVVFVNSVGLRDSLCLLCGLVCGLLCTGMIVFVVLVCYVHCGCCAFCGGVFDGCVERIFCVLGGLWLVVCVFGV